MRTVLLDKPKSDLWFETTISERLGKPVTLWLPKSTDVTTNVSFPDTRTWTQANTQVGRYSPQGYGGLVGFNGTTDTISTPDNNDQSYGNGTTDSPLTIVNVLLPSSLTGTRNIFSRIDFTTGSTKREIWHGHDATLKLFCRFYDESAGAYIGRKSASSPSTTVPSIVICTYAGSGGAAGIKIYLSKTQVDNANDNSGVYTAMENTTVLTRLVSNFSATSTDEGIFVGKRGTSMVFDREFVAIDVSDIVNICSEYYGVAL